MANSVDPDQTPHSAASHLGLHCLLRPVCQNTYVNTVHCKTFCDLHMPVGCYGSLYKTLPCLVSLIVLQLIFNKQERNVNIGEA